MHVHAVHVFTFGNKIQIIFSVILSGIIQETGYKVIYIFNIIPIISVLSLINIYLFNILIYIPT